MTPARRSSAAKPAKRRPAGRNAGARGANAVPAGFEAVPEPRTGGVVLVGRTPLGTPVHVRRMPGFSKAYAVLATRFGSLDTHLPDGTRLPLGLAHFLEHKMFATPTGDVFDVYAKRGATANAYTTFDHTAYLFACTSRFEENLLTLLGTLAAMHADAKGIEREKGIIGQEIAMYEDDPGWRSYFGLLSALYKDHPIRFDPAGSKDTIAPIDRPILERTHAAYYHPANLILCVAGDVDPAAVLSAAARVLVSDRPGEAHRRPPVAEPAAPAVPETRVALSVSRPNVTLGLKDDPPGVEGTALLARETETELLLDVLFGDGGIVEAPLYQEGVVDESLSAGYQAEPDFGFVSVSCDVDAEGPYRERLLSALETARRRGIRPEDVERAKKKALGATVRTFNSPDRLASALLALALDGTTFADTIAAIEGASAPALTARFERLLTCPRAWSVVEPRGDGRGRAR